MATIATWPQLQVQAALVAYTSAGVLVGGDPNNTTLTPVWTDITPRVVDMQTGRGKQYELDEPRGQDHTFILRNEDGAFDPGNTASVYYPQWITGRQIRARAYWPYTTNLLDPNVATGTDTLASLTGFVGLTLGVATTNTQAFQGSRSISTTYLAGTTVNIPAWRTFTGVCLPGQAWTASLYMRVSALTPTFAAQVVCYSATGATLTTVSGAGVVLNNTGWTRATVTFTPPAGTVAVGIQPNYTVLAGNGFSLFADGVQLESGSSASAWSTPGTVYPIIVGFVESILQRWDPDTFQGWVDVTCSDAFGVLSQTVLFAALTHEIWADNPACYYPLNDEQGSIQAGALVPLTATSNPPPATLVSTGAGGTAAFGGTSIVAGDPNGTSLAFSGNGAGGAANATMLQIGSPNGGVILTNSGSGVSVEFWFSTTATSAQPQALFGQASATTGLTQLLVELNVAGDRVVVVLGDVNTSTTFLQFASASGTFLDGKPHHVVATVSASGTGLFAQVDGILNLIGGSAVTIGGPAYCWLGNCYNQFPSNATFQHFAMYSTDLDALPNQRYFVHWRAGSDAFAGEDTVARFSRILSYAQWHGPTSLPSAGYQKLTGAVDLAGRSAMDALLDTITNEQSNFSLAGDNTTVMEARHDRWRQFTPAWTVGELVSGGELPYTPGPEVEYDVQRVFNQVKGSRPGGIETQRVDATSIARHGVRSYSGTTSFKFVADNDLIGVLEGIIWRYRQAQDRISTLTFQPVTNLALWPFALGATIGQRIRFNRRPPGAPGKALDVWVEQISHKMTIGDGATTWDVTVEASPGLPSPTPGVSAQYLMATTVRTTLKTAVIAGATTLVLNALPDAATNTSQSNGWTSSAFSILVIWDGANTELVSVVLLSTTVLGYTQFTATLLSGCTFAHASGVVVSQSAGTTLSGAPIPYDTYDSVAALDSSTNVVGY